jgi:hypothetical protein
MSKEVKILLIVLGSLAALVVIACVGGVVVAVLTISHQVGSTDAATKARTAAKIATFTLPPGYQYMMAMDMGVINMVAITGAGRSRGDFIIQLQGISLPTAGGTDEQLMASMQQSLGKSAHCSGATTVGNDTLRTASGKTIALREIACKGESGSDMSVEFGHIPSNYPLAIIMAMGSPKSFDKHALRELVGSIR